MSNPRFSRRRFITSAGVTITLPMLPSLLHTPNASAASCTPLKRFLAYMYPNGLHMSESIPAAAGAGDQWSFPTMLAPLAAVKSELVLVTGLENYDALGVYRTVEGTRPIDASGVLPDGSASNGAIELGALLSKDTRFLSCTTNKFMIFAIGRLLNQPDDEAWVEHVSGLAGATDGSLPSVIRAVLMSEAFRSRQARVSLQ